MQRQQSTTLPAPGSLVSHVLHHLSGLNVATPTGGAGQLSGEGGRQTSQ